VIIVSGVFFLFFIVVLQKETDRADVVLDLQDTCVHLERQAADLSAVSDTTGVRSNSLLLASGGRGARVTLVK